MHSSMTINKVKYIIVTIGLISLKINVAINHKRTGVNRIYSISNKEKVKLYHYRYICNYCQ